MTTRVNLQPAFLLHSRPYRDTSLLLELITYQYGRISAIARGVKQPRAKNRHLLQPFVPLLVSWSARSELAIIGLVEPQDFIFTLPGHALIAGFYLNELLVRLLPDHDPHPQLYLAYHEALRQMQSRAQVQLALRQFEKSLLAELGYGLELGKEAMTGEPIQAEQYYTYHPGIGLLPQRSQNDTPLFAGKHILALHQGKLTHLEDYRQAKRLMRMALQPLLGDKPLKSRELFIT